MVSVGIAWQAVLLESVVPDECDPQNLCRNAAANTFAECPSVTTMAFVDASSGTCAAKNRLPCENLSSYLSRAQRILVDYLSTRHDYGEETILMIRLHHQLREPFDSHLEQSPSSGRQFCRGLIICI